MGSGDYAVGGGLSALGLFLLVLGLVLAVMWLVLPFFMVALNNRVREVRDIAQRQAELLAEIRGLLSTEQAATAIQRKAVAARQGSEKKPRPLSRDGFIVDDRT